MISVMMYLFFLVFTLFLRFYLHSFPTHALPISLPATWHRPAATSAGTPHQCGSRRRGVPADVAAGDRKSKRLNTSHLGKSYAVFLLQKKNKMACTYVRILISI